MINQEYGDGRIGPPELCRETIEQQRAANKIARIVRKKLVGQIRLNIEAQLSSTLTRLVFHYGSDELFKNTVELDFTVGEPLDDKEWLNDMAKIILKTIASGRSELFTPKDLDYINVMDSNNKCIYELGKHV